LKESGEGHDPISIGIDLQTEGAEKLKARLPKSVRHLEMAMDMVAG